MEDGELGVEEGEVAVEEDTQNKALINKVVMVGMPGLDADLYTAKKEHMPIMCTQLGQPAIVLAKSAQVRTGSTLLSLFTVPQSKKRKRDSDEQQQQQQQQLCHEMLQNGKQIPFPPEHYRMTLDQMESNNYPLPDIDDEGHMTCPPGFMATQPAGSKAALDMVSLDCEMCSTAQGLELTRASLVDGKGRVINSLPYSLVHCSWCCWMSLCCQRTPSPTITLSSLASLSKRLLPSQPIWQTYRSASASSCQQRRC
ncbi:hypothetical protein ABBQ32_008680 [Trebouxia sp. C0010 RCD-2024]